MSRDLSPKRTPAQNALLIVGSFAPLLGSVGLAAAVSGFDDRFFALWLGFGLAAGTVLLVVTALRFPRFLLVGTVQFLVPTFLLLLSEPRYDLHRLASLTISRGHVTAVGVGVGVWALGLAVVLWRARAQWVAPALAQVEKDEPNAGRIKRAWGLVVLLAMTTLIAASTVYAGWTTVWNAGHMTASDEARIEVVVVDQGIYSYSTGSRNSRARDTYWIVEDTSGDRWRIQRRDLGQWEWSTKLTWDEEETRNRSCTNPGDTDIEIGDTLTLAGRTGPLGFAIDYTYAIERDGELQCQAN